MQAYLWCAWPRRIHTRSDDTCSPMHVYYGSNVIRSDGEIWPDCIFAEKKRDRRSPNLEGAMGSLRAVHPPSLLTFPHVIFDQSTIWPHYISWPNYIGPLTHILILVHTCSRYMPLSHTCREIHTCLCLIHVERYIHASVWYVSRDTYMPLSDTYMPLWYRHVSIHVSIGF